MIVFSLTCHTAAKIVLSWLGLVLELLKTSNSCYSQLMKLLEKAIEIVLSH
jgi:hypothetical protein